MTVIEPLVHPWDLATAIGRPLRLRDHLIRPLLATPAAAEPLLRSSAYSPRRRRCCRAPRRLSGATPQQRLLALLGRRA